MKKTYALGITVIAVLITVAIEESRISAIREELMATRKEGPPKLEQTASAQVMEESPAPAKTKSRPEATPPPNPPTAAAPDESFAKTARKMWDNPAGKSMMNQGARMAVAMMYQDFVDGLNLSKEEADYFKNLLGKEVSDQQELGMKMMGATKEEQKTLADELAKRAKESEAEIKKFLNNEEDINAFTDYKKHLPERQQLDGIRSAMTGKGVPLDAETETKLVDAMYRARTESKTPDLSGAEGMAELAKGNIVETYEKNWDIQQQALEVETSKILSPEQATAFQDYQKQAKEMQLMGLKMAEKMMSGDGGGTSAKPEK
jgi:hypothetical protein